MRMSVNDIICEHMHTVCVLYRDPDANRTESREKVIIVNKDGVPSAGADAHKTLRISYERNENIISLCNMRGKKRTKYNCTN